MYIGCYAGAQIESNDKIAIIYPADFPTTMMRTALVSASTKQMDAATAFIRHLLKSQQGNGPTALPPLTLSEGQQTIPLNPALMTYLDRLKRRRFITEWERAIIQ